MAEQIEARTLPTTTPSVAFRWLMLTGAWLAQTSVYLAMQSIGPIAPLVQDDLHISRAQVGLFSSAFSAGVLLSILPAGWIVDRFGARLLLFVGPGLAGLLLLAASRTSSYLGMAVASLLAGLGGGLTSPATTKAVMSWFTAKTRGTAMGIKQTGSSAGGAIAAMTLPPLAIALGWRDALAVAGLLAASVGVLCYVTYRDNAGTVAAHAAGLWSSLRSVLADRDIRLSCLAAVCFTGIQMTIGVYLVLYLNETLGIAIAIAGGLLALAQIGGVAGRLVLGIVSDRLLDSRRKGLLALTGAGSLAAALLTALAGPVLPWWALVVLVVTFGFAGIGWTGIFMALIAELSGKHSVGVGSAVGLASCNIGVLIVPPLFGLLVDLSHSYSVAWGMVAATAGTATALVLAVRERND